MTIQEKREPGKIIFKVTGRLDATNAQELENAVLGSTNGVNTLIMDFSGLDYIASAGIRVLLKSYKVMASHGGIIVIRGANEEVTDVLTITGFADKITMEDL